MLDEKGMPGIVERAFMMAPSSQIGPVTPDVRQQIIRSSRIYGQYEKAIDRESAYEKLQGRTAPAGKISTQVGGSPAQASGGRKGNKPEPTAIDQVLKAANSPLGRQIGRELVRGIMGGLLGSSRGR